MDMRIKRLVKELRQRWLGIGERIEHLSELTQNKAFNNKNNKGYADRILIIADRIGAVSEQILSVYSFNEDMLNIVNYYNSKQPPTEGTALILHSVKIEIKHSDDPFHPKIEDISIKD